MESEFKKIENIKTFEGSIPSGFDLVIAEENNVVDSAMVLYGFDEVGMFDDEFVNPVYGFLK